MGGFIRDTTTSRTSCISGAAVSGRGDALQEMVKIQREFGVFSRRYTLRQAFRLLHIVPAMSRRGEGGIYFSID